jgi:hypothetical protein
LIAVCAAAQAVARTSSIALAWISRPSASESYVEFSSSLNSSAALFAIAQGIAASMLAGFSPGLLILAGCYLILRGAQWLSYQRAGGVDDDSLDVTGQLVEIFILALFTIPGMRLL